MDEDGIERLKLEFILPDRDRVLSLDCVSDNDKKALNSDGPTAKKLKGQNKSRGTYHTPPSQSLCSKYLNEGKCDAVKCKFLHSVEEYVAVKPKDISSKCYIYDITGNCPWGITCRFSSAHPDLNSVPSRKLETPLSLNSQVITVLIQLRKKLYDFTRSSSCVKRMDELLQKEKEEGADKEGEEPMSKKIKIEENDEKQMGAVDDSDLVPLRSVEKKKIYWTDKLYLSPLTTLGNLPFRRICVEYGAEITCSEMALASSLIQGESREWTLLRRHPTETIFGVQIAGNNPHVLSKTAQVLEDQLEIDFVDLNLGCPLDDLYRRGIGSGFLTRRRLLKHSVMTLSDLLTVPFTVKTRTGIHTKNPIAHELCPEFSLAGVSLITVHGRSREQRYLKKPDYAYIEECAKAAGSTPVFGNGDVLSYTDYLAFRETCPSISGVMIGRGALMKPWIFQEIKEGRHLDPTASERLEMLRKYVNYGLEHWGSDSKGVETTRRFTLEWLSFLHRYVPTGLLLEPPQVMNRRPPNYKGRNDLETLMASPSCQDWIQISEMLLGPVPPGFTFLPKHKANAWK